MINISLTLVLIFGCLEPVVFAHPLHMKHYDPSYTIRWGLWAPIVFLNSSYHRTSTILTYVKSTQVFLFLE